MTDVMQQKWACLACSTTFPFGKLMMRVRGQ